MDSLTATHGEVAIRPMTLGTLLDRSLKMTPGIFKLFFVAYLVLAVLDGVLGYIQAGSLMQEGIGIGLYSLVAIIRSVIGYALLLTLVYVTAAWWRGNREFGVADGWQRVTWSVAGKGIWLSIVVGLGTVFFLILLIIPGIIYMLNRILAFYILLIEDSTVEFAIKKSKKVMKLGKWSNPTSPMFRVAAVGVLMIIISLVFGVIIGVAGVSTASGGLGMVASGLIMFVHSLLTSALQLFSLTAYTGIYFDAIARFEGADLISDLQQ